MVNAIEKEIDLGDGVHALVAFDGEGSGEIRLRAPSTGRWVVVSFEGLAKLNAVVAAQASALAGVGDPHSDLLPRETETLEQSYQRAKAELEAAEKEVARVGHTPEATANLRKAEHNFDHASWEAGHG